MRRSAVTCVPETEAAVADNRLTFDQARPLSKFLTAETETDVADTGTDLRSRRIAKDPEQFRGDKREWAFRRAHPPARPSRWSAP